MPKQLTSFLTCGAMGWCLECFWTGMHSIHAKKDKRLLCQTSIWMFPIYGMAALISPISQKLKGKSTFVRGSIYMTGIYAMEFLTGSLLKKHKACPWDYSNAKTNVLGIIRLDYAPLWFLTGLAYEKMLAVTSRYQNYP